MYKLYCALNFDNIDLFTSRKKRKHVTADDIARDVDIRNSWSNTGFEENISDCKMRYAAYFNIINIFLC